MFVVNEKNFTQKLILQASSRERWNYFCRFASVRHYQLVFDPAADKSHLMQKIFVLNMFYRFQGVSKKETISEH